MKYNNGGNYKGYWKNGMRHGKGKLTYHNGAIYVGDWEK
jgi:hypothetical protein